MSAKANCPEIDYTRMPLLSFGGTTTGRAALQIAIAELKSGAGEIGGPDSGEWVRKYLNRLAAEGSAWCAAFVSYCFKHSGRTMPFKYTLSARELLHQLRNKSWSYQRSDNVPPQPGDIVIWWRNKRDSWQGHSGIVHHYLDGYLFTIEGNRTSKVEGFCYKLTSMRRLLGFGRIP